jgi:hypothetical protein
MKQLTFFQIIAKRLFNQQLEQNMKAEPLILDFVQVTRKEVQSVWAQGILFPHLHKALLVGRNFQYESCKDLTSFDTYRDQYLFPEEKQ